jgi:hypothetical protein
VAHFAFQGEEVLSARRGNQTHYGLSQRIEKELRKAEVGMMRLRRDTHSKKTLAALYNELREKVLCVPSSQ